MEANDEESARVAQLKGAQRQFEAMMRVVEELLGKDAAMKMRPLALGNLLDHRKLLRELRKLRPRAVEHTSQSARLRSYDLPEEPSPELVKALQADLAGRRKLAGLSPSEQAAHIAQAAPERWVRNLLQATLLIAAERDPNDDVSGTE